MQPKIEGDESVDDSCLNSTQSSSSHLSANALPGQYLIPPSGTRKRQIEESDDTLVAQVSPWPWSFSQELDESYLLIIVLE